ncbi:MAG: PKD domain-containing protein [Candidatus Thermoplasmatota archaeon]|nr:PKD domain-containing protein [Candidatus Thermoplasmatota archaeon]
MKTKIIVTAIIITIITLGFNVTSLKISKQNDGDWPVELIGVSSISVSKSQFESWVETYEACWSDGDHTWCGVPVWKIAAMVDDPEPEDYSFNEELAADGYIVKLTSWDGWVTELQISDVAHSDNGYIVVNTIDGEELPEFTPRGRASYPLHLRGGDIFSPNTVGGVIKIELVGIGGNNPPEIPEIRGHSNGKTGTSYTYYFSTSDPEENNVYYYIEWGDGSNSDWYGPYASGNEKSLSHTWSSDGTYTIRIKAKDTFNEESDWNSLEVTMPKYKFLNSPIFCRFFELLEIFNLFKFLS